MQYKLDYPNCTCTEYVLAAATKFPRLAAYRFMGTRTSFSRLATQIRSTARSLRNAGLHAGDRVLICLPNVPQALLTFYGANAIGAVAIFVHPLSSEGELEYYIRDSKPRLVVTLKQFANKFRALQTDAFEIHDYRGLRFASESVFTAMLGINAAAFEIRYEHKPEPLESTAVVMYSGGTTGVPKGVMLTDLNFNALAVQSVHAAGEGCIKPGGTMLAIMPIFHGFGLGICVHCALTSGVCVELAPRFTPKLCAKLLRRVNYFSGVPTLFEALLREPSLANADLSQLRAMFCGGDSLSVDLKRRFDAFLESRGASIRLREGYGMTEAVTATCLTPGERTREREGSVGLPYADMQYCVTDDGELCLHGPTVMRGYLGKPEETSQTLQTHADGQTWLHTGDLGRIDDEGYVYFLGRIKRVIMTNGYSVYPLQIEQALDLHPLVRQSCVIGVPHPYKMQVPKAYVVLERGADAATAEPSLRKHLALHVARYALPKEIVFLDSLPKTNLGKVDVAALTALR